MDLARQASPVRRFQSNAETFRALRQGSDGGYSFLTKLMAIEFAFANGKHDDIDYTLFEKEVKAMLPCSQASVYLLNDFPAVVSPDSSIDLLLILAIDV
jgi:hypothetical protein